MLLHKRNITLFLVTALFVATSLVAEQPSITTAQPVAAAQPTNSFTKQQIIDLINQIAAESPYMPQKLTMLLEQINESSSDASLEQNLEKAVTKLLAIKIKPEQREQLKKIQAMLSKKMQHYKASGPSFAADWNGGFIVDTQDPRFTVTYKDAVGNTRKRTYQADISLIGINIELALRLNLIFFVGTDFNFHESNKVIELGKGIQVNPIWLLSCISDIFKPYHARTGVPFNGENFAEWLNSIVVETNQLMRALSYLDLTYVPFINARGGLFIVGAVVGPFSNAISMVTGGTLTPMVDAS